MRKSTSSSLPKPFTGSVVFLSRSLLEHSQLYAAVQDALTHGGAELYLMSDPSRCNPNDYHVISHPQHDKFEYLKSKGCNMIGPECVLSCVKENRGLPKNPGFTCCLGMEGVKVLASGFDKEEKAKIEELVTAMGGVNKNSASMDVSFVIVKNVLAVKYKWASTILKKPIVTIKWLYQCWNEHRVVPHEPYRVLPFSGLTICATGIPVDLRREMEKLIQQNGGKYSADLTRMCTHLICEAPKGDKFMVAQKWGHIYIVTKKWVDQSISRRVRLDEKSYPVHGSTKSPGNTVKVVSRRQFHEDRESTSSISLPFSQIPDIETTLSDNISYPPSNIAFIGKEDGCGAPSGQTGDAAPSGKTGDEAPTGKPENKTKVDGCVADDSQTEDNDLYLSECRILLVGFEAAAEMRRVITLVRRGGGSRYMSFGQKLTHIVVGTPSENEKKEIRQSASSVIHVVKTIWLEECDREKKEVPVFQRHIFSDFNFNKDPLSPNKATVLGMTGKNQPQSSLLAPTSISAKQVMPNISFETGKSAEKGKGKGKVTQVDECESQRKHVQENNVFKGQLFQFSSSFPEDRRAEIIEWINRGGGAMVDGQSSKSAQLTIECHGLRRHTDISKTTLVSTHWIRYCLENNCMPDVGSHIIYSPLPCRIPFPGFEGFRFCVSQYEVKDRALLRNLCFVLGAKFTEKLTKRVTHLICKFASGPKYERASESGIHSVTSEWISECIRKDTVVSMDLFQPKDATTLDNESGLCTTSQYPTQAVRMVFEDDSTQLPSQSLIPRNAQTRAINNSNFKKRARELEDPIQVPSQLQIPRNVQTHTIINSNSTKFVPDLKNVTNKDNQSTVVSQNDLQSAAKILRPNISDVLEVSHAVPDVAAAIEDLLAQSSKIQDMETSGRTGSDHSLQIFSPDRLILGQDRVDSSSTFGIPKDWLKRTAKKDELCNSSWSEKGSKQGTTDGFSETQTDSQVVVYEEDLSGIQMIIDRVRTRSSLT